MHTDAVRDVARRPPRGHHRIRSVVVVAAAVSLPCAVIPGSTSSANTAPDPPTIGARNTLVDWMAAVDADGAGSTIGCQLAGRLLPTTSRDPSGPLTYGIVRDVVVDHPGAAASHGRYLALAVVRREPPESGCRPDPQPRRDGEELVMAVSDSAAETGASTALEVSFDAAWIAARRAAGFEVDFDRYVAVTKAADESPLRAGDVVLLLDGAPVGRGVFTAVAGDADTDSVFTVVRDGSRLVVPAADVERADVRILEAARTTMERPAMVLPWETSGASAGIVSALAYLDAITPGDLTAGRKVAGSGTITPHGYVGDVSGVGAKTEAAIAADADVLFVHPDNLDQATSAAAGQLEIVPVRSLRDAVDWLAGPPSTGE